MCAWPSTIQYTPQLHRVSQVVVYTPLRTELLYLITSASTNSPAMSGLEKALFNLKVSNNSLLSCASLATYNWASSQQSN